MRTSLNLTINDASLSLVIEHNEATEAQLTAITAIMSPMLSGYLGEVAETMKILAEPTAVASEPAESAAEVEARLRAHIETQTAVIVSRNERVASLRETIAAQDECIAELKQKLVDAAIFVAEPPKPAPPLPASKSTPQIGGLPVVEPEPSASNGKPANGHEPVSPSPSQRNSSTNPKMSKGEFDRLVRSEMKRLAPAPNVVPGYATWNEKRDRRLPLMLATIRRYECTSLTELATKLGMEMLPGRTQIVDLEVDAEGGASEDGDE